MTHFTILVSNPDAFNDELPSKGRVSKNEKEANAEKIYRLANRSAHYIQALGWLVNKAFVGLSPEYSNLYPFGFSVPLHHNDESKDKVFIHNFSNEFNFHLSSLERICVSLLCDKSKGRPNDDDMMAFSHFADLDCEALVENEQGVLVMQGYSNGEYDTGYISCGDTVYGERYYTKKEEHNKFFYDLQKLSVIKSRSVY